MRASISTAFVGVFSAACLSFLLFTDVSAHGGGNWNAFRIDQVVDQVQLHVLQVQIDITNLIRGRTEATTWPMPELVRARDALHGIKEEVDEILAHYVIDGMNLQLVENLHKEPRAGRTVAANQAVMASIALIERAGAAENQAAFTLEFYAAGPTAHLYELLDAHRDRMALYGVLMGMQDESEGSEESDESGD